MSKAVMLSIRPRWVEKIANKEKTIEVRRIAPKLKTPFKCYIYMTKNGNKPIKVIETKKGIACIETDYKMAGKVIGEFVCEKVEQFTVGSLGCDDIQTMACLSYKEMIDYFYKPEELDGNTVKFGYALHISQLKIYDKPKELGEFKKERINCYEYPCQCCKFYHKDKEGLFDCDNLITRPPQSWCYVEEISE